MKTELELKATRILNLLLAGWSEENIATISVNKEAYNHTVGAYLINAFNLEQRFNEVEGATCAESASLKILNNYLKSVDS